MPIYEYYCANCNTEYELVRPASQVDDPAPCKTCGRPGQRQLSRFAFQSNTFTAPRNKMTPTKRPFRPRDKQS